MRTFQIAQARTVSDWGQAFLSALADAFSRIFSFLPQLIGALIILWIGWFIAKLLGRLTADVLRKVRFNQAAEKAGLAGMIQSAGVKKDASGVMGEIVKWFFRIIALVAAFSVLELPALTATLTGILNFIPNLAIALVIILIGGLIANFASDFIRGVLTQAGFGNAGLFANIVRFAIIYVAAVAALGQIGVAATVINTLWIGTIAALALALGLAFGLGGRDTAARLLENAYNKAQENMPKMQDAVRKAKEQRQQQRPQMAPNAGPAPVYIPPEQVQPYAADPRGYQPTVPTQSQPMPGPGGYNPPPPQGYPDPTVQNPPPPPGYYDQQGGNYPRS